MLGFLIATPQRSLCRPLDRYRETLPVYASSADIPAKRSMGACVEDGVAGQKKSALFFLLLPSPVF